MASQFGATAAEAAVARNRPQFFLTPLNKHAKQAVRDQYNADYLLQREDNGDLVLFISFLDEERSQYTLGRDENVDVRLADPKGGGAISNTQCAFTVDDETGAVFLWDLSDRKNTETYASSHHVGETTIALPSNSQPSVLVARGINVHIAFGRDRYYQFEITWRCDGLYNFPPDGPLQTGPKHGRKKYVQGDKIGGGAFGNVFWALDVHTGKTMAVKKFHTLEGKNQEFAFREIRNLYKINSVDSKINNHDHILELLGIAGFGKDETWGEIFMPLKEGSVKSLVKDTSPVDIPALGGRVLRHMLRALKTIAKLNIIHRDIKPENILYEIRDSGYHFQLGDFGLSNDRDSAKTMAGTEVFMAPEVWYRRKQTTKIDIWSLFATLIWIYDVDGFRDKTSNEMASEVHRRLRDIATLPQFNSIKDMAKDDPDKRPSAKELLKIIGDENQDNVLAETVSKLTLSKTPAGRVGSSLSADVGEDDEYAVAARYMYESGESSTQGQYGATPRGDGDKGDDEGPDYMTYSGTPLWSRRPEGRGGGGYTGPGTEVPERPTVKANPAGAAGDKSGIKKDRKSRK